jgi:hypothetical protein
MDYYVYANNDPKKRHFIVDGDVLTKVEIDDAGKATSIVIDAGPDQVKRKNFKQIKQADTTASKSKKTDE